MTWSAAKFACYQAACMIIMPGENSSLLSFQLSKPFLLAIERKDLTLLNKNNIYRRNLCSGSILEQECQLDPAEGILFLIQSNGLWETVQSAKCFDGLRIDGMPWQGFPTS